MAYKLSSLTKNIHPRYADHTVNPEILASINTAENIRNPARRDDRRDF